MKDRRAGRPQGSGGSMKRLALVLACVSVMAVSACGNDGRLEVTPPGSNSPVPTATSIPEDE